MHDDALSPASSNVYSYFRRVMYKVQHNLDFEMLDRIEWKNITQNFNIKALPNFIFRCYCIHDAGVRSALHFLHQTRSSAIQNSQENRRRDYVCYRNNPHDRKPHCDCPRLPGLTWNNKNTKYNTTTRLCLEATFRSKKDISHPASWNFIGNNVQTNPNPGRTAMLQFLSDCNDYFYC